MIKIKAINTKFDKIIDFKTIGNGVWAVIDQTLFAGSNFIVSILLARWMSPETYGAFSTSYSIFLLISTIHTAYWTEPMLVYGSNEYQLGLKGYLKILRNKHWYYSKFYIVALTFISLILYIINEKDFFWSTLGIAFSSPLILYLWFIRRACYINLSPKIAVIGGLVYMTLLLALTSTLLKIGILNTFTTFLIMGASSYVAAYTIIRNSNNKLTKEQKIEEKEVILRHINYGNWAAIASIFTWVPNNVYFIILPLYSSSFKVGALKALMNIIMPILHFNAAITSLLIPIYSKAIKENKIISKLYISIILMILLGLLNLILTLNFQDEIFSVIYQKKYDDYKELLIILTLSPIISAVINSLVSLLRALNMPKIITKIYSFGAILSIFIGIPLTYYLELTGVILSILFTNIILLYLFFNELKNKYKFSNPNDSQN